MESSPLQTATDMTFPLDQGRPQASLGSEQPPCLMCHTTHPGMQDDNPETWHVRFRAFTFLEGSVPIQYLRRLSELCHLWLRPDLHTKEEILDQLVIEQFMISTPLDLQVLVRESGVKSCKDLEEMLRSNRRPPRWEEGVLPETIPGTGDLEGVRPRQDLEKDLVENMEEATALKSQEPQLPQERFMRAKDEKQPQEETSTNMHAGTPSSHVLEGDVTENRGDSQSLRGTKRKSDNTPTSQEGPQGGAMYLDNGEFSGQAGFNSVNPPSPVEPVGHPVGKEAVGLPPHRCQVCSKGFRYKSQFLIHQRTHTGERPFKCNSCHKGFMQPSDLRVHQRIHTGEKPFRCRICLKEFTHESTLLGHQRIHTKEKPFACEDCKKCFSHKGNLNVHQRIHTNSKPYTCGECGQTFRQLGTFKRHVKVHSKPGVVAHACNPSTQEAGAGGSM